MQVREDVTFTDERIIVRGPVFSVFWTLEQIVGGIERVSFEGLYPALFEHHVQPLLGGRIRDAEDERALSF